MSTVTLYDAFSEDYDRFVNWKARLEFEMPFFRALFDEYHVRRVLDSACGTGQHALAFAREGYEVTATDLSKPMIERARENALAAGLAVHFYVLGFGELADALPGLYDALTCLGNSLPHLTTEAALGAALQDFARVLKPGGILVIQNRNFDRVLAQQERFMPPEVYRAGDREWIFMRFYDFEGELLRFNIVRLYRQGNSAWTSRIEHTQLRAWRAEALCGFIESTGFRIIKMLGSYRGEAFAPSTSGDLVLIAKREVLK